MRPFGELQRKRIAFLCVNFAHQFLGSAPHYTICALPNRKGLQHWTFYKSGNNALDPSGRVSISQCVWCLPDPYRGSSSLEIFDDIGHTGYDEIFKFKAVSYSSLFAFYLSAQATLVVWASRIIITWPNGVVWNSKPPPCNHSVKCLFKQICVLFAYVDVWQGANAAKYCGEFQF